MTSLRVRACVRACVRVSECAHHCGVPASAMKVHSKWPHTSQSQSLVAARRPSRPPTPCGARDSRRCSAEGTALRAVRQHMYVSVASRFSHQQRAEDVGGDWEFESRNVNNVHPCCFWKFGKEDHNRNGARKSRKIGQKLRLYRLKSLNTLCSYSEVSVS